MMAEKQALRVDPWFYDKGQRRITDDVLKRALLVALSEDSDAWRMVAFCQLVALL